MQTALVTMNPTELDRAAHMQRIAERRTTQAEVAQQLAVSLRQVERMYAAYKLGGAGSLASKRRGRPSTAFEAGRDLAVAKLLLFNLGRSSLPRGHAALISTLYFKPAASSSP
jgi:hypothetical protein